MKKKELKRKTKKQAMAMVSKIEKQLLVQKQTSFINNNKFMRDAKRGKDSNI